MIQEKTYLKNKKAIKTLKSLGYPVLNIRKALHKLTGISQPEMARILKTSRQNVTLTINGDRSNIKVQQRIAGIWNVPVEELFEEFYDNEKTR